MDKRSWIAAAVIVAVLILVLSYQPGDEATLERAARPVDAGVVDLAEVVDAPPVATVELEARPTVAQPTVADSSLVARFGDESVDPEWAVAAAAQVDEAVGGALTAHDAAIAERDCRATICRVTLQVADAGARPAAVAAVLAALHEHGHVALLEGADGTRATMLIGVRTPRTR